MSLWHNIFYNQGDMMKKIIILVTSALFVLTACSGGGAKIGTLMDETGDLGAYGPLLVSSRSV